MPKKHYYDVSYLSCNYLTLSFDARAEGKCYQSGFSQTTIPLDSCVLLGLLLLATSYPSGELRSSVEKSPE